MTTTWPSTTKAPQWEVTQPDPASLREPLQSLWRRNLPTASDHRCDWLYGSGRAQAWLLGEAHAEPTGAAGLMLRRMFVAGRVVEGGGAIDLNVDQTQRSVGPALALVRAVVHAADADGRQILYGMPNRSATAVMKRAGYQELGEFSNWTKLLNCESTLRGRLRSRWLARLAAPLANRTMRVMSSEWRRRLPATMLAESLSHFDERFDQLSTRVASRFDMIGDRSADFLTWRFTDCPDLTYEIFTLADRTTGDLLGYVVWYADEGAASISDLLAIDEPTTTLLLAEFSRAVRQTGWTAIRFGCFASPSFYTLLKQSGFHRRQNRHPVLCRRSNVVDSQAAGSNWFLTMADSDTDV